MARKKRRVRLGASRSLAGRQVTYAIDDGIEVDEIEGGEVHRKRVFFDEVLLVTYHRYHGLGFLLFTGIFSGLLALISWAIAAGGEDEIALWFFIILGSPFVIAFLLRLVFRVDVVTVFGRRTKTELQFSFRKGRARQVFTIIYNSVRGKQDEIAASLPPEPEPNALRRDASEEVPEGLQPGDGEPAEPPQTPAEDEETEPQDAAPAADQPNGQPESPYDTTDSSSEPGPHSWT